MTTRLRIDLAYDGTPFRGFASQGPDDIATVQGTLEGALSRLVGQPCEVTCAGRTDKGVHALAQVVHLDVDASTPRAKRYLGDLDRFRFLIDRAVGNPITIWRISIAPPEFDARFSARERAYRYRIVDGPFIDPRRHVDTWHLGEQLKLRPMQRAAKHLLGEHDYASFCRKHANKHTIRRIDRITVARPQPGEVHVAIRGRAFCHQQVRAITGCLVEVGLGKQEPEWVGEVLAARDRSVAARVSPARGLTLEAVRFTAPFEAAPPAGTPV